MFKFIVDIFPLMCAFCIEHNIIAFLKYIIVVLVNNLKRIFYQIIIKLTWDVLDITEEFTSEFAGAKFAVEKG